LSINYSPTNFFSEKLVFKNHYTPLTIKQINTTTKNEFPDRKSFVEFYLAHNGGTFTEDVLLYPNDIYNVLPIEVAFFLCITSPRLEDNRILDDEIYVHSIEVEKARRREYSDEFKKYTITHLPFAVTYGDATFWINMRNGEIKYTDFDISYDAKDSMTVAASFSDFCKCLKLRKPLIL